MEWFPAPDIKKKVEELITGLHFTHVDPKGITCFRSEGSTARIRARIWSFPKVWQLALNLGPHYVIEVVSRYFDDLSDDEKIKTLIHELLHIPSTFSGSLRAHRHRGGEINRRSVQKLFTLYQRSNI